MTEIRTDYLTGNRVVIAPNRSRRPMGFDRKGAIAGASDMVCPFCLENEELTPGTVQNIGRVRTVPNLYPAFEADSFSGFGFHEVIIDTEEHDEKLQDFSEAQIADIFLMIKERYTAFTADKRIKQVQAFKNTGVIAGASILHSHWQIIGIPFVPALHQTMHSNFSDYKTENGSCYLCDIADKMNIDNELFICESGGVIAYAPYASPFSHMFNILPREHISNIGQLTGEIIKGISGALKRALTALTSLFSNLEYNILLYSAPFCEDDTDNWHFFIQVIPRFGFLAGYELSTGCYISSVYPEDSAKRLRDCIEW